MRIKALSIFILVYNLINAQQPKLIDFYTCESEFRNCDIVSSCIDIVSLINDTLLLSFTTGNVRSEPHPKFSFAFINDSLKLSYNPPETISDTIIFNKDTKKYEKVKYYTSSTFYAITDMDPSCRLLSIKFSGFQNFPKYIVYNGKILHNCPTKNIDYKTYNGDTINIIDKNGFQHGTWFEFYDSGQIMTKKIYKHGEYIGGFQYDRNGQVINKLYPRGAQIIEEHKQ